MVMIFIKALYYQSFTILTCPSMYECFAALFESGCCSAAFPSGFEVEAPTDAAIPNVVIPDVFVQRTINSFPGGGNGTGISSPKLAKGLLLVFI